MRRHLIALGVSATMVGGLLAAAPSARPAAPPVQQSSDLDAFMQKVLARRDENWKKLQQYILEEHELVDLRGPSNVPIWGERRDYSWYIKDGYFVRSPLEVDGVRIPDDERRKEEESYLRRAQERDRKKAEQAAAAGATAEQPDPVAGPPGSLDSFIRQSREPQFVESAYFLRFKFEEGKYALVGRERFEGRDVLRIEYYPAHLFTHEEDDKKKRDAAGKKDRGGDYEATLERMMNKVALVTLWVEPDSGQIVKYTFDNINLDFLPGAWLLRIDGLKASMTMSEPFKDVWLPRDVEFYFSAMFAVGTVEARYQLTYDNYKQATTSARIKAPAER